MAYRISCRCIPCKLESLAATAAKVNGLTRAATARFRHPVNATEAIEQRRLVPYPGKRTGTYILDREFCQLTSSRARKYVAIGGYCELLTTPPSHTRLGILAV